MVGGKIDEADRFGSVGGADRADGGGVPDADRETSIGEGFARWCVSECGPDGALKAGTAAVPGKRQQGVQLPIEIGRESGAHGVGRSRMANFDLTMKAPQQIEQTRLKIMEIDRNKIFRAINNNQNPPNRRSHASE